MQFVVVVFCQSIETLITKEVFVLSVFGKVLLIDEKRLIIETEPKSFFLLRF